MGHDRRDCGYQHSAHSNDANPMIREQTRPPMQSRLWIRNNVADRSYYTILFGTMTLISQTIVSPQFRPVRMTLRPHFVGMPFIIGFETRP